MLEFVVCFLVSIPFVVTFAVGLFVILDFFGIFDCINDLIDNHKVALRRILCGVAICVIAIVATPRLIDVFKSQSHDNSLTPTIVVRPSNYKTGKAIVLSPEEAAEHKENLLRRINPDDEEYNVDILAYTANILNGDKEYTTIYLLEHPEKARALYETIRPMIQGSSVTIQSFHN